ARHAARREPRAGSRVVDAPCMVGYQRPASRRAAPSRRNPMKRVVALSCALLLALALSSPSRAETALGAVFGYPGNIGFSGRIDQTAFGVAWSSDFLHGTFDRWMIKKKRKEAEGRLSWYFGPGGDVGIPLDSDEDFFLAARAPIGLQLMMRPKIE